MFPEYCDNCVYAACHPIPQALPESVTSTISPKTPDYLGFEKRFEINYEVYFTSPYQFPVIDGLI